MAKETADKVTWLDHLGIDDTEASAILAASRVSADEGVVQRASIRSVDGSRAIVERWGYDERPLADLLVKRRISGEWELA